MEDTPEIIKEKIIADFRVRYKDDSPERELLGYWFASMVFSKFPDVMNFIQAQTIIFSGRHAGFEGTRAQLDEDLLRIGTLGEDDRESIEIQFNIVADVLGFPNDFFAIGR